MELFDNLATGFGVAFTFQNLIYCFVGCLLGTLIGVLPGIGPVATIAMLLPITAKVEITASMIFFAGIYYGAMYGGSTTSILLNTPGETASMVKLDVLLTLLLQRQDAGKPLSSSDRALTSSMIINSDNNATTTLWGRIGQHEGVRAANRRFGMTETEPGTSYRWGLTTTTAADQVRLLRNLVRDDGPLDQASRDYALGLMGRVADGQDWGVSAANPQHEAQVKNGWLPRSDGWVVTSAGRAQTAAGHEVLLAAVSCEVSSQQHGIETIEHLAEMAASALDR